MGRTRIALWVLGGLALAWRVAVLVTLKSSPMLPENATQADLNLLIARNVMGLIFLGCGLLVLHKTNRMRAAVFALYAISASVHWGGVFALPDGWQMWAVYGYFIVGAILAESAFLHFSLVFPEPWNWGTKNSVRLAIYFPVALGIVAAIMGLVSDPETSGSGWFDKFMILETFQSYGFAAAGLIIFTVRFFRATPWDGPRNVTGLLMISGWLSVLPWLIAMGIEAAGQAVPGGSDVYTLAFVILPICYAYAVLNHNPVFSTGTEY